MFGEFPTCEEDAHYIRRKPSENEDYDESDFGNVVEMPEQEQKN